jgi:ATP sulfurylase
MTVYSTVSYDEQDNGRILKSTRKQKYIMFPAPIAFLNDELKAELGMKTKNEEENIEVLCCCLKVPIDAIDKESNTYNVKIQKYNMGPPEDILKWRTTLNEKIKNTLFAGNYEMVMNLAQAMLAGRRLDDFVK